MSVTKKRCVDCVREGIDTERRLTDHKGKPYPGPRCRTHHLQKRKERSEAAAERRWMQNFGLTPEEYWAIYEWQRNELREKWGIDTGAACYICGRAKGRKPRLAVDHNHKTGLVRMLACRKCNRDVLGHLRDDPDAFRRALEVLDQSPASKVIGERVAPIHLKEGP